MTLIKELSERAKEIDRISSEKDRIFYNYLTGKKIDIPENSNKLDILKVCYSAYTKRLNEKDLAEAQQKTKPIKGLHYTNNLVELIAIAIHDFAGEKSNLQQYVDSHNAKEVYITNRIFPQIKPKSPVKIETPVDRLVNDILNKHESANGERRIVEALKDANDLLDIFVIGEAVNVIYEEHPTTVDRRNVRYLLSFFLKLHTFLHFTLSLVFYVAVIGSLLWITQFVTPYVVNNWNELEPYIAVWQILTPIIIGIILAGLQIKYKVFELIRPTQEKIVYIIESFLFKLLGVDLSRILEIKSSVYKIENK